MTEIRAPGLRLQIVVALGALMLLAFVPLWFAIARLTEATVETERERAAITVADAAASHGPMSANAHAHDVAPPGSAPPGSAPLERLVAMYMMLFGVALLTFAYFVLTRLIVRPIDALVRSTGRVASGDRRIDAPRGGPRELVELGESVERMAARLLRDEKALRDKVAELTETTRRLTDAQARLVRSERMASVGRLAAGVAHEIGNPIAAISGMEDLLIDGGLSDAEERDFLLRMKRETERIHVILRDLLDFARPEQPGDAASAHAEANVADVVGEVAALVRTQKDFKSTTIAADIAADLAVALDGGKLTQVLLNLVLNAAAAMRPRGGEIRVRAEAAGDDVRIVVEDTGPGLPKELAGDVFEPFVTSKPVGEGSGLGLAVCRGIVEAASGTIAFDRDYTAGARAVVTLPRPMARAS